MKIEMSLIWFPIKQELETIVNIIISFSTVLSGKFLMPLKNGWFCKKYLFD